MDSVFIRSFLAFIKPFNSHLSDSQKENYYLEREWRKFGNLELRVSGIEKIVVRKGYKKRLESLHPRLASKIVELDSEI